MSSVSTTNISGTDQGTDHDFGRPSGTGVFLYRYPGTSYLATITLSLRDKIHSSAEALLKLMLMGARPYQLSVRRRIAWERVPTISPSVRKLCTHPQMLTRLAAPRNAGRASPPARGSSSRNMTSEALAS